MSQRIRRFSPGQTAKVMGALYGLMGLVFMPIFVVAALISPETMGFGLGLAIALPILYALCGGVAVAIGCALYNLVAGWVGGIEVELEPPRGVGQ